MDDWRVRLIAAIALPVVGAAIQYVGISAPAEQVQQERTNAAIQWCMEELVKEKSKGKRDGRIEGL